MLKEHRKAVRKMLNIQTDNDAQIPQDIVDAVERAEVYLFRVASRPREFRWEQLAVIVACTEQASEDTQGGSEAQVGRTRKKPAKADKD